MKKEKNARVSGNTIVFGIVLFMLSILSMLLLALSIGNLVQINELRTQIDEQKQTQIQRYFYSILDEILLDGNAQFLELDTTTYDTIEDFGKSIYVVEVAEMTMVEVTIKIRDNHLEWYDKSVNLNIYYDGVTKPDIVYEDLNKTASCTFALKKGFTTIELDSYSDSSWEYTMMINQKR